MGIPAIEGALYGLQTASSNLKRTNPQPAWDEVETEMPSFEQEVWHKNIAVDNAQRLLDEDIAERWGGPPGAGLNKDHRKQSAESRKPNVSVLTTSEPERETHRVS